jgi:guanine nucleotide-binding protein G(i) subunit alpha
MIFVASLSEFNQRCYEDDVTNRMLESLELFDELVNGDYFKDKQIFLFLNKLDIFTQKISKKDLCKLFSEYEGGKDVEAALEFIQNKYRNVVQNNSERLYIQIINAMDEDSVINAFKKVQNFYLNGKFI